MKNLKIIIFLIGYCITSGLYASQKQQSASSAIGLASSSSSANVKTTAATSSSSNSSSSSACANATQLTPSATAGTAADTSSSSSSSSSAMQASPSSSSSSSAAYMVTRSVAPQETPSIPGGLAMNIEEYYLKHVDWFDCPEKAREYLKTKNINEKNILDNIYSAPYYIVMSQEDINDSTINTPYNMSKFTCRHEDFNFQRFYDFCCTSNDSKERNDPQSPTNQCKRVFYAWILDNFKYVIVDNNPIIATALLYTLHLKIKNEDELKVRHLYRFKRQFRACINQINIFHQINNAKAIKSILGFEFQPPYIISADQAKKLGIKVHN